MPITPEQAWQVYCNSDPLYTAEEIEAAFDRMAQAITRDLAGKNPLILCIMNGGLLPSARLLTRLQFPLRLDYIHATRYRGETSGGELHWLRHPAEPLQQRSVLLIDDILDEGFTLQESVRFCQREGAAEVRSAVLAHKRHTRGCGFVADYIGLEVEDRYVFGYGMDYHGYLRNADGIFAVKGGGEMRDSRCETRDARF